MNTDSMVGGRWDEREDDKRREDQLVIDVQINIYEGLTLLARVS